jgi:hypothetical protein
MSTEERLARFWRWFAANSERLQDFESDREAKFEEVAAELHRVHDGLTFAFGPVGEGGREFVVSADGVREVFPAVQALVAAAPPLPGWRVVAFRPRESARESAQIQMGDVKLGMEDVWFKARPDRGKVGLTLYVRGLSPNDVQQGEILKQAAFIFLDHVLGEYDVETKVGAIDWKALPRDPAARGLKPFTEITAAVDELTADS